MSIYWVPSIYRGLDLDARNTKLNGPCHQDMHGLGENTHTCKCKQLKFSLVNAQIRACRR